MYTIIENTDGSFTCECRIQDGVERWQECSKENALRQLIKAARGLNGSYIREDDISFVKQPINSPVQVSVENLKLLEQIRCGEKVVLNFDDKRIKYRLTDQECDLIVKIREYGSIRDVEKLLNL